MECLIEYSLGREPSNGIYTPFKRQGEILRSQSDCLIPRHFPPQPMTDRFSAWQLSGTEVGLPTSENDLPKGSFFIIEKEGDWYEGTAD